MIQRTFHPIGQGAFYSEQHKNFTIVYDCGSKTKSSISDLVVKNAFPENHIIDILFISHFDKDHVNKISILKNQYKIKRVVLPLLHDFQKISFLNILLSRHHSGLYAQKLSMPTSTSFYYLHLLFF